MFPCVRHFKYLTSFYLGKTVKLIKNMELREVKKISLSKYTCYYFYFYLNFTSEKDIICKEYVLKYIHAYIHTHNHAYIHAQILNQGLTSFQTGQGEIRMQIK